MAVWELALLVFAVTYMMVNTVALIYQVKLLSKFSGVTNKGIVFTEKMIDKAMEEMDE